MKSMLERLAVGETTEKIIPAHPQLILEDIRAAIEFAAGAFQCRLPFADENVNIQTILAVRATG